MPARIKPIRDGSLNILHILADNSPTINISAKLNNIDLYYTFIFMIGN